MGNALGAGPGGYWFVAPDGGVARSRILLAAVIFLAIIAVIIVSIVLGSGSKGGGDGSSEAYYLASGNGESTTKTLLWSENGSSWNSTTGSFERFGRDVKFYDDAPIKWTAVGADSVDIKGTILWSMDGKSWNKILSGGFKMGSSDTDGGYSICYSSSLRLWVAVGGRTDGDEINSTIQWSSNGKNWNFSESGGFTNRGIDVYYDENRNTFVVTGVDDDKNKTIQISTDGKNWSGITGSSFDVTGGTKVIGKNR